MMEGVFVIPDGTKDISGEILDTQGRLRVLPAGFYAHTTRAERGLACVNNGLYGLPTLELAEWLTKRIAGRRAIEIGAGNGSLAAHLGIHATDSFMQDAPNIRNLYAAMRQPRVRYGANVEAIEALDAVTKYKPQVVIGSWITHRYNRAEHHRGGNMYGPDAAAILKLIEEYILIGNEVTHRFNPLWDIPHEVIYPEWLYSRSVNGARDFIAVWKGALCPT